jgi:transposase
MEQTGTRSTRKIVIEDNCTKNKYLTAFQRKMLEKKLQALDLGQQYRQRIEIMLLADAGKTQSQICQQVGCCHATASYWILMARSGQAHNWEGQAIGRPKSVSDAYLQRLRQLVSQSPRDCGYPFRRWTAGWLSKHLAQEFEIELSARHVNRLLKKMGLSTRSQPSEPEPDKGGKRISIEDLSPIQGDKESEFWCRGALGTPVSLSRFWV